jgi:putative transcriptional regulator
MTTSPDAIKDIAKGKGPQDFIITLGYTGWGPGQLNDEISENAWLTFPEDYNLIFKTNPEDQINEISKKVGYDIRMISPDFGNA